MGKEQIDGFGILLSTNPENARPGTMIGLKERHVGQKFALRKHPHESFWHAIGHEGTYGREGLEWEITSEL